MKKETACLALLGLLAGCTVQVDLPDGGLEPVDLPGAVRAFGELVQAGSHAPPPPPVEDAGELERPAAPPVEDDPSACPSVTVCGSNPDGMGFHEFACIDPAGYRFVTELCDEHGPVLTCPDYEHNGRVWRQECIVGFSRRGRKAGEPLINGCSPRCEMP